MNEECVDKAMEVFLPGDHFPEDALLTGIIDLDQMTGGFRPGSVYIIGARPGVGKSLFAYNMMIKMSVQQNIPAMFFSLGMPSDVVIRKIICAMSMVEYRKSMLFEEFDDKEMERLGRSAERLKEAPVTIDDTFYANTQEVTDRICRLKEDHAAKIVFIDHLQLLPDWNKDTAVSVREGGSFLRIKKAAVEAGVPVVIMSNVSRNLERRKDRHPRLYDFELPDEALDLADGIIGLYRDNYYKPWNKQWDLMEVRALKCRYGWCSLMELSCLWDCLVPSACRVGVMEV